MPLMRARPSGFLYTDTMGPISLARTLMQSLQNVEIRTAQPYRVYQRTLSL